MKKLLAFIFLVLVLPFCQVQNIYAKWVCAATITEVKDELTGESRSVKTNYQKRKSQLQKLFKTMDKLKNLTLTNSQCNISPMLET